jgi:hypothetical protein
MCEEIKMKKCSKCGEEKPLTSEYFYVEKTAKEGFRAMCKDCTKSKYNVCKDEDFNILTWYENKSKKFKDEWKLEDIKWIHNNYLNINKKMLKEKFPNKSYKTLTNIIYQWDIRKTNQNDDWSEDDIKFLIDNYPNISQEELEKRFKDRTWDAVKNKASKLGVERSKEFISNLNRLNNIGRKQPISQRINQSRNRRRENNHNWKGGLTPLITYFRSILYEWKLDSLKKYNFKCALTNTNNNDLEIHHVNENFSDMVYKVFEILKLPVYENMTCYNEDELKLINKIFLELNYKNGLGIPLKKSIHRLYHAIYGKENNNEEQFKEFIQSYRLGEFNEQLKLMEENSKIKVKKYKTYNGKKYRKLIKEEVIEIRNLLSKNMPDRYIANLFKVSELAIYNIRTNKTWKDVG